MNRKQKEALAKYYLNASLLALGSLVFGVFSVEKLSLLHLVQSIIGLILTIIFLLSGMLLLKGIKK